MVYCQANIVSWARQLLQIFATPEHPLIIVVDDIQWMPQDEAEYWRLLLTGSQAINHVLVITTCRVGNGNQPPTDKYLSPATVDISVPPLSEDSVHEIIKASFHDKIAAGDELASFLHSETGGSSLFVRTLLATLVKDKVIYFDFETLIWRFDAVLLQKHLSKAGVDQYLERLILSLPAPAQQLLFVCRRLASGIVLTDSVSRLSTIKRFFPGPIAADRADTRGTARRSDKYLFDKGLLAQPEERDDQFRPEWTEECGVQAYS